MLDHAREAVAMAQGRTRADLNTDRMLELALTRLVTIVGEAATRVQPATRQKMPNVSWSQIVGLRNRLIHGYDAVDLDILWDIVQTICRRSSRNWKPLYLRRNSSRKGGSGVVPIQYEDGGMFTSHR
jgi:uncharacterized protein with HEPN domain